MKFKKPYTVLIRRGRIEYIGICLELNVSARGKTIVEVEQNLKNAVDDYLDYANETNLSISPIPSDELIEFIRDTSPPRKVNLFHPLRLQEVPSYV